MNRIMIVDDEILAIQYLENMIAWKDYECEVVAKAVTVTKAIELLKMTHPDIVFMDIRMPKMSGLELSQLFLQINPKLNIIILTAYQDFQYAQEALKIGVMDFLVKHELNETIVVEAIEKAKVRTLYEQNIVHMLINEWIRENWRIALDSNEKEDITGKDWAQENVPASNERKLEIPALLENKKQKFLIVLNLQSLEGFVFEKTLKIKYPIEYWNKEYGVEILGMVQVEPITYAIVCQCEEYCSEQKKREEMWEWAQHLLERCESMSQSSGVLFVSKPFTRVSAFGEICDSIKHFAQSFLYKKHKVLFPEDYYAIKEFRPVFEDNYGKKVLELLYLRKDYVWDYICAPFAGMTDTMLVSYKNLNPLRQLVTEILTMSREQLPSIVEMKISSINDLMMQLKAIATSSIVNKENIFEVKQKKVRQVLNYIHEHYGEDISSTIIATTLDMSDGYLRDMFKKETGYTIKTYILDYRIQIAKQLLLSHKYKIYEISSKCGFRTSQHFSMVFHNVVKVSPGEFASGVGREKI